MSLIFCSDERGILCSGLAYRLKILELHKFSSKYIHTYIHTYLFPHILDGVTFSIPESYLKIRQVLCYME